MREYPLQMSVRVDFEDLARQHPVLSAVLAGGRFPFEPVPPHQPTEPSAALNDPRFVNRISEKL